MIFVIVGSAGIVISPTAVIVGSEDVGISPTAIAGSTIVGS